MDGEMMECIDGNMVMKKSYVVHALRIAVGITILALLLTFGAGAATLTVCPSGCSYSSIQKAIKASSNGDTILVKSSTYFENVKVNKKITLRGIGNPVVDAGGSGSAITLAANGITLEGFTATGSGGQYDYPEAGIKVTSSYNILSGNNASNNGIQDADFIGGISLWFSSNNTLTDNYVSNNGNEDADHAGGISLWHSSNNTLGGNKASNNYGGGIHLSSSSNNILSGNNVSYNGNDYNGIYLDSSSNNTLSGNNASNNYGGIVLSYSSNNKLTGNTMTGNKGNFDVNGDTDSDFDNYIDMSNLADGRPIYYIIRVSDATYDSSNNAGILYCISCVNVTLKNLNLNKNGYGIFFWNTTHSKIQNVNASNNGNGIYIKSSSNNTLTGNNGGIFLYFSSNNTISGNNASNNYGFGGIFLSSSSNNTLSGNTANWNNWSAGISLESSSNNTLSGNNASNNFDGCISLYLSSNNTLTRNNASKNRIGIFLESSSNNTLSGNTANSNRRNGISLSSSSNSTLTGNIASNNKYGIYLSSSSNNTIYNNIFNNNNNFDFQDNNYNTWNTKKQSGTNIIGGPILGGNFWANPDGTGFSQTCQDLNNNGICEKRYILNENNIDYLPLSMNFTMDIRPPKSVSKLKNATYAKNFINWTWKDPKDIDFKKVMVFIDGQFKKNVSKGKMYYNATNFNANTRHTISTRTVDINGNINKTWANVGVHRPSAVSFI